MSGAAERRALFALTLPPAPVATVLDRATFVIHLETNADVTLSKRRLRLHPLTRAFTEARASWTNYDKGGNAQWVRPGADFDPEISRTLIPQGTSSGDIEFDVTAPVQDALDASVTSISWIVLETSVAPAPPAELSFVSADSRAVTTPALVLEYCDD